MVIAKQKIYDSGIDTQKIAPDTIIAADIDETVSYNWAGIGSTFAGVVKATRIQPFTVNDIGTTSTARSFPTIFSATPKAWANYVGATTSSSGLYITANSASSYTLFGPVAGTAMVLAVDMA